VTNGSSNAVPLMSAVGKQQSTLVINGNNNEEKIQQQPSCKGSRWISKSNSMDLDEKKKSGPRERGVIVC
jgi:hypothetical protein